MSDLLSHIRQDMRNRMAELEPIVEEFNKLAAELESLDAKGVSGTLATLDERSVAGVAQFAGD